MAVSEISSNANLYQANSMKAQFGQIRKNFQQLGQALQLGDLSIALQSFSALQQLLPNLSAASQHGSSLNSFAADFNTLGQALKSGDLSKARNAYIQLQQDMEPVQKRQYNRNQLTSGALQNTASISKNSGLSNANSNYIGRKINVTT